MNTNGLERNDWRVQPDNTVQVVNPPGVKSEDTSDPPVNWNGIMISLGIISFVGIMVTVASLLLIPLQRPPFYGRPLTLQDLSDQTLASAPLGAQWLSDNEFVYISESDGLLLMNTETSTTSTLISGFTLQQIQVEEFSVSSDRFHVLLIHDIVKGRLFKRTAKYSIYDIGKNHYYPLKLTQTQLKHPRYQHVQWIKQHSNRTLLKKLSLETTPESTENGSELVIVFGNNIYYMAGPHGPSVTITEDGVPNEVFNGIPNIMNEEIMRSSSCLWPNPRGDMLAYVSFVDTEVQQIPIIEYGAEGQPNLLSLRYPTVTSSLPEATVWIAKVPPGNLEILKWRLILPVPILRDEHYIVAVGWSHSSKLWVSEISRDQSMSHLMTCEEGKEGWECTSVHVNHVQDGISPAIQNVVWLENWAAFPWPTRTASGWWYNHVALVGVKGKKHPTYTLDGYHVKEVLAADSPEKIIYFLGSKLNEETEKQQLYSVSPRENSLVCISCVVECPKVKASLNEGLTHAVITCVETYVPTMHLIHLSLLNEPIALHTQTSLSEEIQKIALPIYLYKKISLSVGVHASVILSLPPGWVKDDDTLFYPLMIHLFGIESYDETDVEHHIGLQDLLTSGHYTAHAQIRFWESDSYHHEDSMQTKALQMGNVIRVLLDNHQFLDSSRVSIWGWGSGASIALKLSELNLNLKCVMAVNPVMDWKQYGSYWSEKLLGSIYSEGAVRRYEESNILRALDALNNTQIMLVQSTKDPLSHHSTGIAQYLISKGIYFQHLVYPDSSVALRKERIHVIKSFKTFIAHHECIKSLNL